MAAELVISNKAASKFRMRSAACSRFLEEEEEEEEGDFLDADAIMAVADRVGDSVAVIAFVGWRCLDYDIASMRSRQVCTRKDL